MFNFFVNIQTEYLIYILYGSSFLFLGFAIFIKDMKGSDLRLADSLWLLGMFGLTHGARELLELYPLIEGSHLTLQQIINVKLISLVFLVASFLFLLQFGLALTRNISRQAAILSRIIPPLLLLLWIAFLINSNVTFSLRFLGQADTAARYIFCIGGSMITAYGLIIYSEELHVLSRSVSRHLRYAGITFVFYGFFAGVIVSRSSIVSLPFPIELLRAVAAFIITYFITKALNIFNIETRKRIEQQTQHLIQTEKLTSLGQLAAGIAHEINNPLTNASLGIQTLIMKLGAGMDGNGIVEKLDAVERNIDKASAIARELLQFSRQQGSPFAPVNLNRVVRGALTLLQYKVRNIVIRQDIAELPDVMGDAGKLEQVIINILSNAVEAMPEGGTLTIETGRSPEGVRVCIRDTGGGIPERNLLRVFDPFFTTKKIGTGTGLGLSICYGIIRDHHGKITVTSTVQKGTAVTITIPERKVT